MENYGKLIVGNYCIKILHRVYIETNKLFYLGNCAYGRCLLCREKHTSISFVSEENIALHIKNPLLKSITQLEGGIYEVEKSRNKVLYDVPIQIGIAVIAVYSYAKMSLIKFWKFINHYLENDSIN